MNEKKSQLKCVIQCKNSHFLLFKEALKIFISARMTQRSKAQDEARPVFERFSHDFTLLKNKMFLISISLLGFDF